MASIVRTVPRRRTARFVPHARRAAADAAGRSRRPAATADDADDLVGVGRRPRARARCWRPTARALPDAVAARRGDPMCWWSARCERGVLPLDGLRVSRSLRQSVRRLRDPGRHRLRRGRRRRAPTRAATAAGSTRDIRAAYTAAARAGLGALGRGLAGRRLAGGLYGVAIGGLFAGESMFHRERDASKVALVGAGRAAARRARRPAAARRAVAHRPPGDRWAWSRSRGATYLARLRRCARPLPLPRCLLTAERPVRRPAAGWPVSLTIGRPAAAQSTMPPSRLTDVVALLRRGRPTPARTGRRPCRPRASARRAPRRAGRAARISGMCDGALDVAVLPTRRARARRGRAGPRGAGRGRRRSATVGMPGSWRAPAT